MCDAGVTYCCLCAGPCGRWMTCWSCAAEVAASSAVVLYCLLSYCYAVLFVKVLLRTVVPVGGLWQVDDLLAMQSCNLMCLQENCRLNYCGTVLFVQVLFIPILFSCTVVSVAGG